MCVLITRLIWATETASTAGRHLAQESPGPRVAECLGEPGADPRQHAQAPQRRDLDRELGDAADEHPGGKRVDGRVEVLREAERRADEAQVQQHRREGGHREPAPGVEDAGGERHQRHEQDVREHPAGHHHRGIEGLGLARQAGGHQPDQRRRGDHAEQRDREQNPEERGRDLVDHLPGASARRTAHGHGPASDEGLREGPFREHAPQQVRQAEGDEERVGEDRCAEDGGGEVLADQSGDPGEQRQAADRGCRPEQIHLEAPSRSFGVPVAGTLAGPSKKRL